MLCGREATPSGTIAAKTKEELGALIASWQRNPLDGIMKMYAVQCV
jgi:hypothetical protein